MILANSELAANNSLLEERMIPLNEAARLLPRPGGRQISKVSLWRWATKGVKSGASRVRLETIKVGGTRYTTVEAIERFAARLDPESFTDRIRQAARSTSRRRREARAAATQLKADGFM